MMSQFENDLVNLINGSDIPIFAKKAILEATLYKVVKASEKVIQEEINALNEEKPETIKEEGKLNAESTRCEL
jgi:hypothetical protein